MDREIDTPGQRTADPVGEMALTRRGRTGARAAVLAGVVLTEGSVATVLTTSHSDRSA